MKANVVSRISTIQMKFIRPMFRVRLFLIQKAGPEGLGRKNFKIWTRYNYNAAQVVHADIGSFKRFRISRGQ
jgi:hypothetical protein